MAAVPAARRDGRADRDSDRARSLTAAATGGHLAGGTARRLATSPGITGLGLLCAAALGGGLSWTGPTAYLLPGVYALYTQWHGPR